MSDEFPRPSGDAITDRKRQRSAEAKRQAHSLDRLVRRQLASHPHMSGLEKAAVEQALNAGEQFGYGNVMAWLATEWAVNLRDKWNLPDLVAIDAVSNRGPYPLPPNDKLKCGGEKKD